MATTAQQREALQKEATTRLCKALSHPLRSEILTILCRRTASPSELANELEEPVGKVSHHIRQLVKWDCAEPVSERTVRGATEHFYRATTRNYVRLEDAQGMHPAIADHYAGQVMEEILVDFLAAAEADTLKTQEDLHLTTTILVMDSEGYAEALDIEERARLELLEVEARSADRMARSKEAITRVSSSRLCFRLPAAA